MNKTIISIILACLNNVNGPLKTQAVSDNQVITKSYVDQYHPKKDRSRRDLAIEFYNESSDLEKSQNKILNDYN